MTFHQLSCIVEVARLSSISKAAESIHISQPTLSGIIKDLEKEYSIVIFLRSNKGITLTPEGGEFISRAQLILSHVEKLQNTYCNPNPTALLKLSTTKLPFVYQSAIQLFNDYGMAMGEGKIKKETSCILEGISKDVVNNVVLRKANIGVIVTTEANDSIWKSDLDNQNVEYHFLTQSRSQIIMRKDHPLSKHQQLDNDDIQDYPVVLPFRLEKESPNNNIFSLYQKNLYRKTVLIHNMHSTYHFVRNTDALFTAISTIGFQSLCDDLVSVPYLLPFHWNIYWIKNRNTVLANTELHFVDILTQNAMQG